MSEQAVKSLQKEVLSTFEEELVDEMSPEKFNALRKLVFRSTFLAYRLGFLGPEADPISLRKLVDSALIHVMNTPDSVASELDEDSRTDLLEYCLEIWLDAFRIGAIDYAGKAP